MARYPNAAWRGPVPNENSGGMLAHYGLVLHIMEGTLDGTDSWFHNPAAQVSAHFGNPKGGGLVQWVDTDDKAWAEAAGNPYWVSVENEGNSGDSLTDSQVENLANLLVWLHGVHGVHLQVTDDVNTGGLAYHALGGAAWGGHYDCPGAPIIAQRPQIVARALEIAGTPAPAGNTPPWPGRYLDLTTPMMQGADVQTWQSRMSARGWAIGVDGWFGPQTNTVCRQFQQEKGLAVDGVVGPVTWSAAFTLPVTP